MQITAQQAAYLANERRRTALMLALSRVFDRWLSAGVASAGDARNSAVAADRIAIVFMIVLLSTVLGERLRASRRRVPVPFGRAVRVLLQGRAVR